YPAFMSGSSFLPVVGVSPSGKAQGFDPCIPRFESWHPSHTYFTLHTALGYRSNAQVSQLFWISTMTEMKIFSGNSNKPLALKMCEQLGIPLGKAIVDRFSDNESMVEIQENVRGCDVFI